MLRTSSLFSKRLRAPRAALAVILVAMAGSMAQAQAPAQGTQEPAAVPAPTVAAPRQPTPAVSSYRINAGDQVEINVWGEERLQRDLTVLPDGTIAFPLVGQLRIAGMLPQDVERMVTERLRNQYRGEVPFVTVSVKAPAGMRYSIIGRVRGPGVVSMTRYVTVLEALSQAGGPDEFANVDNIVVVRQTGDRTQTFRVRLGALLKGSVSERDIANAGLLQIAPGDVIIVP